MAAQDQSDDVGGTSRWPQGDIVIQPEEEEEGKHKHEPDESPAVAGEEEASGSAPAPTSDDDVGKMVEEVTGQEPKPGETVADIVNQAERERRIGPDETETGQETE